MDDKSPNEGNANTASAKKSKLVDSQATGCQKQPPSKQRKATFKERKETGSLACGREVQRRDEGENERKLKAIRDMHADRMKLGYNLLQVLQNGGQVVCV